MGVHWVIGDIHGMLRPLEALLGAIARRDPAAHFVFAGDYVNRGPESRRVIDLLLTLPNAIFLRGNHDDIFDLLINGDCYICHTNASDIVTAFTWFMQHGLAETLMSYGADWVELEDVNRRPSARRIERLVRIVPAPHRQFIRSLRPVFETENFFVAHGYWNIDDPDTEPSLAWRLGNEPPLRYRLLWGRFTQTQVKSNKRWKRHGYFGHTPVFNYPSAGGQFVPVQGPKITLLDTAPALSVAGLLSGVCAEAGTVLQADRAGATAELA